MRQAGVNLAAPGSRKADNGTLWVEYPPAGGPSPRLSIRTTPPAPATFRMHTSQIVTRRRWRGSARRACAGCGRIERAARRGQGRAAPLHCAYGLPRAGRRGSRPAAVRRCRLQGKGVLSRFDIAAEAGRQPPRAGAGVSGASRIDRDLTIDLRPCADAQVAETVLSGVEVLPEGW